jgi:hypothetical protein
LEQSTEQKKKSNRINKSIEQLQVPEVDVTGRVDEVEQVFRLLGGAVVLRAMRGVREKE